jgi:hypothetical protein
MATVAANGTGTPAGTATATLAAATGDVRERASSAPLNLGTTPNRKSPTQPAVTREPTVREIQERAYYNYLARGGVDGDPASDWLRAERELREEFGRASQNR